MDYFLRGEGEPEDWLPNVVPPFNHNPLDHKRASIRLIRILPELRQGLLQCEIRSIVLPAYYTCLSYVWGEDTATYQILLNDQLFFVRKNLLSFLEVARRLYPLEELWIDAICIDQASVRERNHQVAQMGKIYSSAQEVIVWLGRNASLARFLQVLPAYESTSDQPIFTTTDKLVLKAGYIAYVEHPYWRRAWITQELALAKSLTILADDFKISGKHLKNISNMDVLPEIVLDKRYVSHWSIAHGMRKMKGLPLFVLIDYLADRQCSNVSDQIYSLLSLAAEGERIPVDYDAGHLDFVAMLAATCTNWMCVCSFGLLGELLGYRLAPPVEKYYVSLHYAHINAFPTRTELVIDEGAMRAKCFTCSRIILSTHHESCLFCLRSICPWAAGHIYLQKHADRGTFIFYSDGTSEWTYRIHDHYAPWATSEGRSRYEKTRSSYTLPIPLELLLLRELHDQTVIPSIEETQFVARLCPQIREFNGSFRFLNSELLLEAENSEPSFNTAVAS